MSVLFIRKPSETPNIQNIDDIRMVRYAYGNQNGYIKGYGAELSHNATGSTFLINSGIFVIQGAEVKIDANGWSESVSGVTNKRYYIIYGEVNLALQTAEIKSTYSHTNYPTIEASDDLTQSTDGTAREVLYKFTATNGIISDVVKVVKGIDYFTEQIAAVDANIRTDLESGLNLKADLSGATFTGKVEVVTPQSPDSAVRLTDMQSNGYFGMGNAWKYLVWDDGDGYTKLGRGEYEFLVGPTGEDCLYTAHMSVPYFLESGSYFTIAYPIRSTSFGSTGNYFIERDERDGSLKLMNYTTRVSGACYYRELCPTNWI